ncbi:MAG: ATP-dependent DNA helicase RecG [Clostridia bacterium]|nr:ATP-dependent DNA helicase RecG [Clostridia bacterium]
MLPGVGPAKAAAYAKMGVETLGQLIYHVPRSYENRGDIRLLENARDDGKTAVLLTVSSVPVTTRLRGKMSVVKFKATDDSGVCELVFFNQPYLGKTFVTDSVWRFYGNVVKKKARSGFRYEMSSPVFERWSEDASLPDFTSVYPLSEGLTQKQVAENIREAIRIVGSEVVDVLPDSVRVENNLCTLDFALKNIHNPADYQSLAIAKRRLVFEELFLFSMALLKRGTHKRLPGAVPCARQNITPLLGQLPYTLTDAQKNAIREVAADMKSDIPMSRIVIGDVGCGKTMVAAAAICIAVMSGHQAAMMVPTEILAAQHYESLSGLFEKIGIETALLTGASSAAEKRAVKKRLASTDPKERLNFVIGTHALLTDDTVFSDLALAVTDEQHRFGVGQRTKLAEKAEKTHMLTMSATPIPRSLALVLYGELDISKIDQMPAGRQKVDTYAVDESKRDRIDAFIRSTVADGGQVYIVCPSIEESTVDSGEVAIDDITDEGIKTKPPLKAATAYAAALREKMPDITVALIHGRLKAVEKEAIMTGFAAGDIDVLVSTTVIEVGVNVPNASLMIVENAERFGLSQLHQLRGRVGRGSRKSYCVLVSDDKSEMARSRLEVMTKTNNGFEIAEADLKNRGPGDFLSNAAPADVRQSGGLRFRFSDLGGDGTVFAAAGAAAKKLMEEDPELDGCPALKAYMAGLSNERAAD